MMHGLTPSRMQNILVEFREFLIVPGLKTPLNWSLTMWPVRFSYSFSIIHKFIEGILDFSNYGFLNMLQYMVVPCILFTLVNVVDRIVLQSESESHLPEWPQLSQDSLSAPSL